MKIGMLVWVFFIFWLVSLLLWLITNSVSVAIILFIVWIFLAILMKK